MKPQKVWIYVTNACNAKCFFCLPNSLRKGQDELSKNEVINLIREFARIGVKRIALTGGEPTLRDDLFEFIKVGAKLGIRMYVETNGDIGKDYIFRMKESGLSVLNLSLDGSSAEMHDEIRGIAGLFNKNLNAIRYASKTGLDVRVYSTVSMRNIESVIKIPDLFLNLKFQRRVRVLTFAPFMPVGRGALYKDLVVPPNIWKKFCDELEKKRRHYKNIVPIRYEPIMVSRKMVKKLKILYDGKDIFCLARDKTYMYVSSTGQVFGCVLSVGSQFTLGNIRESTIQSLWLNSQGWNIFGSTTCTACALRMKDFSSSIANFVNRHHGRLTLICPLILYPKIEPWPYEEEYRQTRNTEKRK